jgi:hypothetical protein
LTRIMSGKRGFVLGGIGRSKPTWPRMDARFLEAGLMKLKELYPTEPRMHARFGYFEFRRGGLAAIVLGRRACVPGDNW